MVKLSLKMLCAIFEDAKTIFEDVKSIFNDAKTIFEDAIWYL